MSSKLNNTLSEVRTTRDITMLTDLPGARIFKYLNTDHQVDDSEVLTRVYDRFEKIEEQIVIAIECAGPGDNMIYKYAVVPRDSFIKMIEENQNSEFRQSAPYHEVIFGYAKQKLKFDVDIGPDRGLSQDAVEKILVQLDEAISNVFYHEYRINLRPDNIITTSSSGEEGGKMKYSFHKIINGYYVTNHLQAAQFTKLVNDELPIEIQRLRVLDLGINKSTQNLRLLYCNKIGSSRVKVFYNAHQKYTDTLVTYVDGCVELKCITGVEGVRNVPEVMLCDDDIDEVTQIVESHGLLEHHSIRTIKPGLICYDRLSASHCHICDRVHDHENSLIVTYNVSDGVVCVRERCRRDDTGASRVLGRFATMNSTDSDQEDIDEPPSDEADEKPEVPLTNEKRARLAALFDRTITHIPQRPDIKTIIDIESAGSENVYDEPVLRPFEHDKDTLLVIAGMKMGKTKKLLELINTHYVDTEFVKHSIIFLSFRQTFSANIKEKFPGFTLYSDVPNGELAQLRLIVQVESFHRMALDPSTPVPDLIVIDESELIFDQFNSGLSKQLRTAWMKFCWYIANAKHVICMDAAMSDRSVNIMRALRPMPISIHHNIYKNAACDNYYLTADKAAFYVSMNKDLAEGKKIAIATSSKNEAMVLQQYIKSKNSNLAIGIYSSDTQTSIKRQHFGAVDTVWSGFDVLIYTPTVSAGVSYEMKHFDVVYAWFSDMSCNVEVCLQMLGRVRDIAEKRYIIGFEITGSHYPTTTEDIIESLYKDRKNLYSETDASLLQFNYDRGGFKKYIHDEYFCLFVENLKVKNISHNSFVKRFVSLVTVYGANVHVIEALGLDLSKENLQKINKERRETSNEISDNNIDAIVKAPDIMEPEFKEIQEKMHGNMDVTIAERNKSSKFQLRTFYAYGGDIDYNWVKTYKQNRKKQAFRNLCLIMQCDNMEESCAKIKADQRERYAKATDERDPMLSEIQMSDVVKRYQHRNHEIACGILKLCGWSGIRDRKFVSEIALFNAFQALNQKAFHNILEVMRDLKLTDPDFAWFTANCTHITMKSPDHPSYKLMVTRYVNVIVDSFDKILRCMYDLTIKRIPKEQLFKLSTPKMHFVLDKDAGESSMPSIHSKWRPPSGIIEVQTCGL